MSEEKINKKSDQLGNQPISKLLFRMSLPATVGMMVGALYQIVDAVFIGQNIGAEGIGAITLTSPLFMFVMAMSVMFSAGTASIVARLFGAKKMAKLRQTSFNSLFVTSIINIVVAGITFLIMRPLISLLGASGQTFNYAIEYSQIALFGSMFFGISLDLNALIRSEGKPAFATIAMASGVVINLTLDAILIIGFGLGMTGAAIATLVGEFLSFVLSAIYLGFSKDTIYRFKENDLKLDFTIIKEIFTIGFPSFIRNFNSSLTELIANSTILFFGGPVTLAAYGIISRILGFMFLPMFGIVQGAQPIIGFNFGAKKLDRVYKATKLTFLVIFGYSVIGALLVFVFASSLFGLFTGNQAVILAGLNPIRILMVSAPALTVSVIAAVYYQAVGRAKTALILSLLRQIILLLPLMLILPQIFGLGVMGIWLSYILSDFGSAAIAGVMLKQDLNKLKTI